MQVLLHEFGAGAGTQLGVLARLQSLVIGTVLEEAHGRARALGAYPPRSAVRSSHHQQDGPRDRHDVGAPETTRVYTQLLDERAKAKPWLQV